jgi:diguanylate cyclase (GGDEF)-like protein
MRQEDGSTEKDLHAQMTVALERKTLWLNFAPRLEERFERDRRLSRGHNLRVGVLIALAIYDLFLFPDFRFLPQHFVRCLIIRLVIVTPITLGTYFWLRFNPSERVLESLILAVSCIVAFSTLYIWHGVGALPTAFAQTALILLILFVNTIMRPSFRYALASTMFGVLVGAFFLYQDPWLRGPEKITCISLVVTGVVFALVANYWMEREERFNYLLRMQSEAQGTDLSSANRELTRLSNLDALTALANRRYFSRSFEKAWDDAVLAQQPISLLLIDIDHFKRINDEFGHLCGDETLVQVGKVLRDGLRNDEGIAARLGGEEFVVLLPGIAFDKALIIAERLRRLTRAIHLPMQNGVAPAPTTISIGVSSARPMSHDQSKSLLRDADAALYEAKARGRDRIWPSAGNELDFADSHFELMLERLGDMNVR